MENDVQLSETKQALLDRWLKGKVKPSRPDAIARRETGDAPAPLSFAQQRLWVLSQFDGTSGFYNIPVALRLTGRLDVGVLRRTLDEIVSRHEILRTRFVAKAGEPLQVIDPPAALDIPIIDLTVHPEAEREATALKLADEEARRPFDLAADHPIRVTLIRMGEDAFVILFTLHHIASDGWSTGVLIGEIAGLYAAFADGAPSPLAELPIQYADFALWQRRWLAGDALDRQTAYWLEQLDPAPALLALPTDFPRPSVQRYRGAQVMLEAPAETLSRLNAIARQHQATLFMVLAAAFDILLARYSGQTDIAIGTGIAGRTRSEIEPLIGFFVNTLVLRTTVEEVEPFPDLLARVRATTLNAYANQDVPFERLVELTRPERHLSHAPLVQATLALQNTPQRELTLPDVTLDYFAAEQATSKFDLSMHLAESGEALTGMIEYDTDLFAPATIERIARHFVQLLAAIAETPEARIADLAMLSEAERTAMLHACSDTASPRIEPRTVHTRIEAQAARTPDRPAVQCGDVTLSYAALNDGASRLAHTLRARGARPETVVGLCLPRSPELIVAMLAVLKAGAAYLPLDPDYPPERLAFMLADSGCPLVVTQGGLAGVLPTGPAILDLDEETGAGPALESEAGATPQNLAYVIYTSGSTGRPKGVLGHHDGLCNLIDAQARIFGLTPEARVLQFASFSFDAATWEIVMALAAGATLCLAPREDLLPGRDLETTLRRLAIDTATLPPVALATLDPDALPDLRTIVVAGEACSAALVRDWAGGRQFFNAFGPTETTVCATIHPCDAATDAAPPIGRPLLNTGVYVLDGALNPVPPGATGALYVSGAGLARGYLNRPDLTAAAFIPDPFSPIPGARMYRTGDLARLLPDGTLHYAGRADHQVKLRGFRIEPGEIEAQLTRAGAREAVVILREDAPGNPRLVAYHTAADLDSATLRARLAESLPEHMVPSAFVALEALPLTPNGKLDRRALPEPDAAASTAGDYEAPRGETEEAIAAIWAGILGVERIGRRDNFFALGGHSLLATRMVAQLRRVFAVELPLRAVFEAPTLAGMAERLATLGDAPAATPPLTAAARPEVLPLSFAQQRLWFLDQMLPDKTLYHVPIALRATGPLDLNALAAALAQIVQRHEVLRTRYVVTAGQPGQQIDAAAEIAVPLFDLGAMPSASREAETMRLAREEAARPFDLAAGPPIRCAAIRLSAAEHVIVLTVHHIAFDGWSAGVLARELSEVYAARIEKRPARLAPLPLHYADFAIWQRDWLKGEVLDAKLAYWRQQLDGAPALLELPTDRPRPAMQSLRGASHAFTVPEPVASGLRAMSRRVQGTLFMTLHAAFAALLSRYSGQDDICIGTPVANRGEAGIEPLIGFFVNTLVLRLDVRRRESFLALLRRAQGTALDAYAHQDVPFEHLVEVLNPQRDLSHTPLFQAMLVLQNAPAADLALPGVATAPFTLGGVTAKYDLTLTVHEEGGQLACALEYCADLFDAATIQQMAGHLLNLLAEVAENPERSLADIPVMDEEEREAALIVGNRDRADYAVTDTAPALFAAQALRTPDAVALVHEGETVSYRELNVRANRLAHALGARGVGPDSRVALCLERGIDLVVGVLGVLKAGGAYVPLDPAYPPQRLAYMLEDSAPAVLVTQRALAATLPGLATLLIEDCRDEPADDPIPLAGPDHLAYVIYTSGSTGKPKGVAVTHRNLARLFAATQADFAFTASDVWTLFHSVAFDFSVWEIWGALLHGGRLVIVPKATAQSPEVFHALVCREGITVLNQTPSAFRQLITAQMASAATHALRCVVFGGEALDTAMLAPWYTDERNAATRLINMYGITETTVHVSYRPLHPDDIGTGTSPIGRPLADLGAYILDAAMEPVPRGVSGELYIAGGGLARGYLGRPALTAERFVPDPFGAPGSRLYRTGDLARRGEAGQIDYLGRNDEQVKIRGFRIELGEIQAAIAALPGVRECVVLARDFGDEEKRLVAYVVRDADRPATPGDTDEVAAARAALSAGLPDYMIPAHFVELDYLPLTANGKLDRGALPLPDTAQIRPGYEAPQNDVQRRLARIWAQVLKVERVGIHDNFFEIGGSSLSIVRVHGRLAAEFGAKLSVVDLFRHTTIARLALVLAAPLAGSETSDGAEDSAQRGAQRRHAVAARRRSAVS